MKQSPFILPALLVLSAFACKDPDHAAMETEIDRAAPVFLYTSLADTLPPRSFRELNVGDVTGVRVKYLNGKESRYFSYEGDATTVLRTISRLPFPRDSARADSGCREITFQQLAFEADGISADEYQAASFFWAAPSRAYSAFECIKGTAKHTLLIHRSSKLILHRVSYL